MNQRMKLFAGRSKESKENVWNLIVSIFGVVFVAVGIVVFDEVIAEKFLLPICDFCNIKGSLGTRIFACLLVVGAVALGWNLSKKYIEIKYYCAFALCLFLYLYYKLNDRYFIFYGFWIGFDYIAMIFAGLAVGFLAYRILGFFAYRIRRKKNNIPKVESEKFVILYEDNPIEEASMDILGFDSYAQKIANAIIHYNFEKSFSIGLMSPWGGGKSSMLKLIESHLKQKDVVLIWFNPRQSFNEMSIQKDFLSLLSENLKEYHSGLNGLMRRYMKDLNVISADTVWSKIFGLVHIDDIENSRNKIKEAIKRINKKIVVFIDDFDRLTGQEIMEMLKLIDQNASFRRTFFVTAYDKGHVNNVLNSYTGIISNDNSSRDFTDKFFNIELQLPSKPSNYKNSFLLNQLLALSKDGTIKDRQDVIEQAYLKVLEFMDAYLPTIRDVKRYLNLFLSSYLEVQDDVVLSDYLLVTLIKYRYEGEYNQLRSKELLEIESIGSIDRGILYFKEKDQSKNIQCCPILKLLFPESVSGLVEQKYNSAPYVCNKNSFDTYFFDYLNGRLYKKDLNVLWHPKNLVSNEFKRITEKWSTPQQIEDVKDFIIMKELIVKDRRFLELYLKLISLSYSYLGISDLYIVASKYFFNYSNGKELILNLKFNSEDEYKKWLFELMSDQSDLLLYNKFLARLLRGILTENSSEKHAYLTINEVRNIIMESFMIKLRDLRENKDDMEDLCSLFSSCIGEVNQDGRVSYVEEAITAFKEKMLKQPALFCQYLVVHEDVSDKIIKFKFALPIEILFPGDEFEEYLEKLNKQYEQYPENLSFIKLYWNKYKENNYTSFCKEKRVRGKVSLGNYQQYLQVMKGNR